MSGDAETGTSDLIDLYEWLRTTACDAVSMPAKEAAGFVQAAAEERLGRKASRRIRAVAPEIDGLDDSRAWAVGYLGDVVRLASGNAEPLDPDTAFLGYAREIVRIRSEIDDLATSPHPVLLIGERGTGKGQLMRAMQEGLGGGRSSLNLVSLAATTAELADSELFGHEKGSFTGAVGARRGIIRSAIECGQAVFLDDIGECPEVIQTKLLSTLDDGLIRPVGSDTPVSIGRGRERRLKVVASIQPESLYKLRSDLRDRLWFLPRLLPPLRKRGLDVLLLADMVLDLSCQGDGLRPRMTRGVRRQFLTEKWPGNVRELMAVVERSVKECREGKMDSAAVSAARKVDELLHGNVHGGEGTGVRPFDGPRGFLTLQEVTVRHIREAMRRAGGNVSQAAKLLKMPRTTLHSRLEGMRE